MTIMRRIVLGDLDLTEYPFAVVFGADMGSPVTVSDVVDSMLQDGEVVSSKRTSNRKLVLPVFVEEADLRALAVAEAALLAEAAKEFNTLAVDPGDGYAESCVFEVFRPQVDYVFDDAREWAGYRRYDLTFPALPFARAEELTTVPALTSGGAASSTVIADGSSAANWSGTATVTASGGTLRQTVSTAVLASDASGTVYGYTGEFVYTPGSPITAFATQGYLYVDTYGPSGGYSSGGSVSAYADGVALEPLTQVTVSGGGVRWFFRCTDPSVASLRVYFDWQTTVAAGGGAMPSALFQIDNVTATNQAPSTASTPGREALRTITVAGSARTPASLAVEHDTSGLGKVLVYSNPALEVGGYAPNLRVRRVSGSTSETADSSMVSGKRSSVGTAVEEVFQVPTRGLPRGGYLLLALPTGAHFTDVQTSVSTRLSSGALIGTKVTRNRNVQTVAGFDVLADLTVPPADVPGGSGATVEIAVLAMAGAAVQYDEMFLCALGDDAALTLVDCGTGAAALGTANSRLWIESATVDRPVPTIWLGTAAGRADAYHAGGAAGSWMPHQFVPPSVTVFVANTGGANPAVSASYYERAHTHIVGAS